MKRSVILFAFALMFSFTLHAQDKKAADKLFGEIAGTWRIQTIYDGKKDVTKKDSTSVQWMEFREDGRYKSMAAKQPLDSGSYRVNENQKSLYLQSDSDKDNPSEWKMEFKESTMTLSGLGSTNSQRLKYVYVKTISKENANRPIKPQQ